MERNTPNKSKEAAASRPHSLPQYVPPVIITYSSDEILEQIGPAYACSPTPCATGG